jgi:hypothetical protein
MKKYHIKIINKILLIKYNYYLIIKSHTIKHKSIPYIIKNPHCMSHYNSLNSNYYKHNIYSNKNYPKLIHCHKISNISNYNNNYSKKHYISKKKLISNKKIIFKNIYNLSDKTKENQNSPKCKLLICINNNKISINLLSID